MILCIIRYI